MPEESYEEKVKRYTLAELVDVRNHIDQFRFPDRYQLVVSEIARRTESTEPPERQPEVIVKKYNTFWRRYWAGIIDGLVFWPIAWIADRASTGVASPAAAFTLVFVIKEFGYIAYSILMHGTYGQTLGKMAVKIKVLDVSESKLSMTRALRRDAVLLILMLASYAFTLKDLLAGRFELENLQMSAFQFSWVFVLLFASVGWFVAELLTMLTNRKRRAVHDFIAGSVVVKIPDVAFPDDKEETGEGLQGA